MSSRDFLNAHDMISMVAAQQDVEDVIEAAMDPALFEEQNYDFGNLVEDDDSDDE